ncbi:hypothetical protein ACLEPN_29745 [Myxococcus sp. 1LA]
MRIHAVVMAVLLLACGGKGEDTFWVRLESQSIECRGQCYFRLDVSSDGNAQLATAEAKGKFESYLSFSLTESEKRGGLDDVWLARTQAWAPTYGCPDCVDRMRYDLEFSNSDEVRRAAMDPTSLPEYMAPLIRRMEALLRITLR